MIWSGYSGLHALALHTSCSHSFLDGNSLPRLTDLESQGVLYLRN